MKFIKQLDIKYLLTILCLSVLLLQLAQVLYFQREVFFAPYDVDYWKDRVEHSRYNLPLSNRGIGDGEFYAYGGYTIIDGKDPTKVVYDKPALGVSLVGFFAYFLNNPSYSGLFFGLGSVLLTFLVVFKLTKSILFGLLTSTFLLLDPLFFNNLSASVLDLPQLFFLLTNIFCLLVIKNKILPPWLIVLASGVMLGIFAQIKIPVLYPIIFALELFWLWKSYGKPMVLMFVLGTLLSVSFGYLPYLLQGYSLIDFLKIQKYIVSFYRDSNLPLHIDAIWQFLFFGRFPDVSSGVFSQVAEWSIIIPIATILGVLFAARALFAKKESNIVKGFAVVFLISIIIFTFIPSYPRYLIIILPFLYFFMVKALLANYNRLSALLIVLLFVSSLINTFYYFHSSPSVIMPYFYTNFSNQYFQDIYQEQLDNSTKKQFTREEFNRISRKAFSEAKIRKIEMQEKDYAYSLFAKSVSIPVIVTYNTEYLGEFSEKKHILLVKENSKWKVKWEWSYLFNELDADSKIESQRTAGVRGKILDKSGSVLVEDKNGYLVSINPAQMDARKEKSMLGVLSKRSYVPELDLQNTYLENPLQNEYVPLFTTSRELSRDEMSELQSYKGIKLEAYPTRIFSGIEPTAIANTIFEECCTRIYSSYNYHGRGGAELEYEKLLAGYDGGSLLIRDKNGKVKRTILQKEKKDGQDVVLP